MGGGWGGSMVRVTGTFVFGLCTWIMLFGSRTQDMFFGSRTQNILLYPKNIIWFAYPAHAGLQVILLIMTATITTIILRASDRPNGAHELGESPNSLSITINSTTYKKHPQM